MIYQIVKGSIDELTDPTNDKNVELEIRAEAVYPMDFGDAAFTSFEGNEDWIKCFEQYPQINPMEPQEGWYIGKIHSHHNMNVFHSNTDDGDLEANAKNLPFFLSLIVNYATELDCKLAVAVESQETVLTRTVWKFKNWKESQKNLKKEVKNKNTIYTIKCTCVYEQEGWLVDQAVKLREQKRKPSYSSEYSYKPPQGNIKLLKDNLAEVSQPVMKRVLEHFSDLVSLGCLKATTALEALNKINQEVDVSDVKDYNVAFKGYFITYWCDKYFNDTKYEHTEVIAGIKKFLNHHDRTWIVSHLNRSLDELVEEYESLWPFQGTSLV